MIAVGDSWDYSRWKLVGWFLGAWLMLGLGLVFLFSYFASVSLHSISRPFADKVNSGLPWLLPLLGVLVLVVGLFGLVIVTRLLIDVFIYKTSTLRLKEDGIQHTDTLMRQRHIRWDEIQLVRLDMAGKHGIVTIQAKNTKKIYIWPGHYSGLSAKKDTKLLESFISQKVNQSNG